MNMSKSRFNIGLAVATITDPFSNQLARGAMLAAERLDANLFIFPGKYVGVDLSVKEPEAKYEYQYNVLFSHAANAKLDHLIVAAGTIAYTCDVNKKKELLRSFGDTPLLSVSAEIEGYDFLQYDNRSGIIQAVDYLARQGKKHIGMLYGVLSNSECAERYEAYLYALKKNGLEFKKSYAAASDISYCIKEEAEMLIDSNPELDAVLCANDMMAAAVYDVLHEKDLRIGRDIAVVGFDDLPLASKLEPPLASVRADACLLGQRAVEKAVNYLNGIDDGCHYIDTQFIPRQSSCGQPETFTPPDTFFSGDSEEIIGSVLRYISGSPGGYHVNPETADFIRRIICSLEESFILKKTSEKDLRDIMDIVDAYFNKELVVNENAIRIHALTDGAYNWTLSRCPDENIPYLRQLYVYFYKRLNLYILANCRKLEESYSDRIHFDNLVTRDTLFYNGNLSDSYARILKKLHHIGSDTSYIYTFEKPIINRSGDVFPEDPVWYFKGYAYGAETFTVPAEEQRMTCPQVFCNKYLAADRRHTMIAADLFSAELQYGMLLCEPETADFFDELEFVTYQISSVLKTIELLKNQEKMLAELHSRNLVLENISKIDELTGINNRRGFYLEAEELIGRPENNGKSYIVCYADMNDLKVVNDSYGHIEGDFSLNALARCMKYIFGDHAVVGRTGGDEFAAIVLKEVTGGTEELTERCRKIIEEINTTSGKPYRITMSMGLYECECENSYDLKDALDKADDKLYEHKARKAKNSTK